MRVRKEVSFWIPTGDPSLVSKGSAKEISDYSDCIDSALLNRPTFHQLPSRDGLERGTLVTRSLRTFGDIP
jgi:hypothetical protein